MGGSSLLRSPKKEEVEVPGTIHVPKISESSYVCGNKETYTMDELESIWGIEDDQENTKSNDNMYGHLNYWDSFIDWKEFKVGEEEEEDQKVTNMSSKFQDQESYYCVKREINHGFWDDDHDDDKTKMSLNLSLNYEEILDAWSDRGPLWADDHSSALFMQNNAYMREVLLMEEDRTRINREASVLRYKEKRQSRLFSKKIRYQVRKLNADKRPRLKGRFVKRVPEKILK